MVAKDPMARLLESGNLVVQGKNRDADSEIYAWQSFDYPTDTSLAGMKIGWNMKTCVERYLTSWKSSDDPSTGDFSFHIDIKGMPQVIVSKRTTRMLRLGPWNGVRLNGVYVRGNTIYGSNFVFNENESHYMFKPTVSNDEEVTRVRLSNSGNLVRFVIYNSSTEWRTMSSMPYVLCDRYGYCGATGVYRINGNPICDCLEGFTLKSQKKPLDCKDGDGFKKLVRVKVPDLLDFWSNKRMNLEECKEMCSTNCSCAAYANSDIREGGSGCLMWFGDLIYVSELKAQFIGLNFYIRLSKSELSKSSPVTFFIVIVLLAPSLKMKSFYCSDQSKKQ
ncbi:G-type lectin S-receptor-like serine/threonine-protein kinase At4g27290 [Ziziphus jujuba]|uniref:G-type lectin S-receptor-like serine/threonine-protein kinase At4g27290 n=1 Tax=Ziziphus jujuba TaxID=326968 RepID=A0ABM3ZZJ9_ZIZJJ|nr:G-type lectin S-receptor-like serine/threonine-protein kinase At4g27290 [Ziziphus jujuba]